MAPCIFPEIMVATFFSKISFFPSGCWTLKINFGWNNTVCSKDMEIGSFPQKWMWRPYMVDLCSIPFDASRRPLQFICGSQTPTQCSFDARVDKPPKRSKMGGFPKNFTEVQKNRKFRDYHATAIEIFDTKVLKRRIFRGLFPMYLQADKHGDFCAIFEWRFGAPNDVRT